jgi:hypothetical protein
MGAAVRDTCFVAPACLLVAPANLVQNGLLAGIALALWRLGQSRQQT